MGIFIVDTTLRDGEQSPGLALGMAGKLRIAGLLDELGVYQIEAGIPAMGSDEKTCIRKMAKLGLNCRIAAWNRLDTGDIDESLDTGVDVIHVSVPSSDIQISSKLNKDRNWILENLKRCVSYVREKGVEVTVGLEDASRADFKFLLEIVQTAFDEGASRIRYADTVGILYGSRIREEIAAIRQVGGAGIEIHAHNDFGMAVSNSLAACMAGADYVNCTVGGIGERAGNCDFLRFVKAAQAFVGEFHNFDEARAYEIQTEIMQIVRNSL